MNLPPGCKAEQLHYAAVLLCEALGLCLDRRRFWWTDVVLSRGGPPSSVGELSSGLKLSFVVGASRRQGDPQLGAAMGQGQAWELCSELPALQPSCVIATFLVSDSYAAHRFDHLHWLRSVGFRIPPVASEPQRFVSFDGRERQPEGRDDGLSAGGALSGATPCGGSRASGGLDELDWEVPSCFGRGASTPDQRWEASEPGVYTRTQRRRVELTQHAVAGKTSGELDRRPGHLRR